MREAEVHIDGQCHCGAIQYEADIDETRTFVCHCEDCQSFSGSAFRIRIIVPSDRFEITRGSPRTYTKVAESGNQRVMHFCENCGTHIYGSAAGDSPVISLSGSTARQKSAIAPTAQVWVRSALPWVADLPDIERIERQGR